MTNTASTEPRRTRSLSKGYVDLLVELREKPEIKAVCLRSLLNIMAKTA